MTERNVAAQATKTDRPHFKSGVYIHYKGGRYKALFTAWDSNSPEKLREVVVYVSLTTGKIFTRPLFGEDSSWSDDILLENADGTAEWVPRFKYVGDSELLENLQ